MTTLYGIKNCDTIKKAQKWLKANQIDFTFHDYRVDGLERDWLVTASKQLGWENLLNKRGTTFRQLPEEQKAELNETNALSLMMAYPAMIKRPILQQDNQLILGFSDSLYQERLL